MKVLRVSHSAVVGAWRERERALARRGVDVHLVTARAWDEGGTVVPLVPDAGEQVVGARTWGTHPNLFLLDPRVLWRAFGERWDVVDVHEEPCALVTAEVLAVRALRRRWDLLRGRRPGAPAPYVLYSAQNLFKRYPQPFRALERAALRGAAAVSTCNRAAARIVRAKGATGAVEVVPLGVDLARFSPGRATTSAADPPADRPVRVAYAGRLTRQKGVDVLLRAVADDPRLHLRVAGAGPEEAALRELARAADGRVAFLGPLDADALVDLYRDADVLALPSVEVPGLSEQFGRVAVEAMACGTPVVATRTGSVPDVVGGAGIVVPPGDPVALRTALVRVGTDDALAARLREAGAARARECSWDEVAARYVELYETATARGRRGPAGPAVDATDPTDALADPVPAGPILPPPVVVVVAYGSPELLRQALAPLVGKLEIVVVDNSSLDAVREVTELAGGRYLDPGRNGGFAAGVNHALDHLPGDRDVLLLNPDAVVGAENVLVLQRRLHAVPGLASVGPRQVDGAGRASRVAWRFPEPGRAWAEAVGAGRVAARGADYVVGSVLLLRAEALHDVGRLDDDFFLYAEETDWAYRAHVRGWRHAVVPDVTAVHLGGATSSDPERRDTHFYASQERYFRKHHGATGWRTARLAAIAGSAARAVVTSGATRATARRRLRLHLRGPLAAEAALAHEQAGP